MACCGDPAAPPCPPPCPPAPTAGPEGTMAPADTLLTKAPAPQSVPCRELPPPRHELACNAGAHTSSGLATAGFRTARYLPGEWARGCQARYHEACACRGGSERQRRESRQLAAETQALARRAQAASTRQTGARLQDTQAWQAELGRQAGALQAEAQLLQAQARRLRRALDAVSMPLAIATDNLQSRERRQHPDLVRDCVEEELLKEAELIRNVQQLLQRTIMQAEGQIRLNREHKETCEMSWSDKAEAYNIDEACTRYSDQSTDVQLHPHSAAFQESASTPETWAKFTQEILCHAERERLASANLRALIDCVLRDTAEDLRLQSDAVNLAFGRRCEELQDSCQKLEDHLYKTLREIAEQERNVAALRRAIRDKEAPLRVAQTRLYQRSFRPNAELCRDAAQLRLTGEVGELHAALPALQAKLLEAEQALRDLEDTRLSLEKDIAVRAHSLAIDRDKCLARRARYPSALQLAGCQ